MHEPKAMAAKAALEYVDDHLIIGVGTGSTANYFIQELATIRHKIDACVASSNATAERLRAVGISVVDLNTVPELPIYFDGADEITKYGAMIKGGGGALTREKIIATAARQFICMVDEVKLVTRLGNFPIAVEALPMARGLVARALVKLGGNPQYREGMLTDNGNIIIDTFNLDTSNLLALEEAIKLIPGVVESGVFAKRVADKILIASSQKVTCLETHLK